MISDINKLILLAKSARDENLNAYEIKYLTSTTIGRIRELELDSFDDYLEHISLKPDEINILGKRLLNSYSEFFRNGLTFAFLEKEVFPHISKNTKKRGDEIIRVWCAACASGQEAYSVAIILNELILKRIITNKYLVFASDLNTDELLKAEYGIYDYNSVKNVKFDLLEKYFIRKPDFWIINKSFHLKIHFEAYDLLDKRSVSPSGSIYGDFDVILSCNILIYYTDQFRETILRKVHNALKEGGFLVTDDSEVQIVLKTGLFRQVSNFIPVFERK